MIGPALLLQWFLLLAAHAIGLLPSRGFNSAVFEISSLAALLGLSLIAVAGLSNAWRAYSVARGFEM